MRKPTPYKIQASEHQIMNDIQGYLRFKGYKVFRMNSGKIPQTDSYGKRRLISLMPAGTPDLMAFKKLGMMKSELDDKVGIASAYPVTHTLFVEVKTPGNKPTILQKMAMEELAEYGAICLVAYSIDDLAGYIK